MAIVRDHLIFEGDNPAAFQQSVRLKYKMLRQLNVVITLFFGVKFLEYATQGFIGGNQLLDVRIVTWSAAFDVCNYCLLLYIFRPREWPEYFGLQLGD